MRDNLSDIKAYGLRLLARRDHSTQELLAKLGRRTNSTEVLERVLSDFNRLGYLDDSRFARMVIASRHRQGYGPLRIRKELEHKGVPAECPEIGLVISAIDWFEAARLAWAKRFGQSPARDIHTKAKQVRFLQYRGFELDQIDHAMNHGAGETAFENPG